jgi:hypothetical protein
MWIHVSDVLRRFVVAARDRDPRLIVIRDIPAQTTY